MTDVDKAPAVRFRYDCGEVLQSSLYNKRNGYSLRCLKGESLGLIELGEEKYLVKIIDLLGRETEFTPNTALIYVYSNGTTERILNPKILP